MEEESTAETLSTPRGFYFFLGVLCVSAVLS